MPELWPFRPLAGITEGLEWFTEVLPSFTEEQRIALRSAPRQTVAYAHSFDPHQLAWARHFTRRNGDIEIYVPMWLEKVHPGVVATGATSITFDTTYGDWREDGYLAVWTNSTSNEVVQIDTVSPTGVTLLTPVTSTYVNTVVMPVRTALMPQGLRLDKKSMYRRGYMQFQVTDNIDLADAAYLPFPVYQSLDVLIDAPQEAASTTENIVRTSEYVDNGFGLIGVEPVYNFVDFGQTISFRKSLGAELWALRKWLHKLRGKQQPFWFPTFNQDFELQATAGAAATTYTVRSISPTGAYLNKHIMIYLRNGNRYFREIVNAANIGDNDTIQVNASIGEAMSPDDVLFMCYISKVRLNSDSVAFNQAGHDSISTSMPITEVQV